MSTNEELKSSRQPVLGIHCTGSRVRDIRYYCRELCSVLLTSTSLAATPGTLVDSLLSTLYSRE